MRACRCLYAQIVTRAACVFGGEEQNKGVGSLPMPVRILHWAFSRCTATMTGIFCFALLCMGVFLFPHVVIADTRFESPVTLPPGETRWTADESPYVIFSTVSVPFGSTLHLESGTIVKIAQGGRIAVSEGSLEIFGATNTPVIITDQWDSSVGGDTSDGTVRPSPRFRNTYITLNQSLGPIHIEHADIRYIAGIQVSETLLDIRDSMFSFNHWAISTDRSTTTLSRVSFATTTFALMVTNGVAEVADSSFSYSDQPAIFTSNAPVTVNRSRFSNSAVAIAANYVDIGNQVSVIRHNSFVNNSYIAVYGDGDPALVDARENWWGDESGPFEETLNPGGLGDPILGALFVPWLTEDPFAVLPPPPPPTYEACCSSVAFIPGLMASRLYRQGTFFEDKLWEPNTQHDARQLMLSPDTGASIDPAIYTKDVLDEPLSASLTGNIYKGFLAYMNGMVASGTINQFEPFPYDWRVDVRDVAKYPIPLPDGQGYKMVERIAAMASTSQTGKVTLVTHSNGGLVAKELMNELVRVGKEHLVDQIIMVAAPQLGTPDAIWGLLHGAEFFLHFPNREVTRELGENMKSGYALLPSREYFNRVNVSTQPIIEFSTSTSVTAGLRSIYGDAISTYENFRSFVLGDMGVRTEPAAADVDTPNVLKEHFVSAAESHHDSLDTWVPPEGVKVIEIVGWGLATPYGVRYDSAYKTSCSIQGGVEVCGSIEVIDPEPLITYEGDETVVYPSAEALGGEKYYVKINDYNEDEVNRSHKSILEIEPLQNHISTLIQSAPTTSLPDFIFSTKPIEIPDNKRLELSVHSPVTLHLYDSFNRHTGPIANPDPTSDLDIYEEQIPNSYYWQIGEGQYAGVGGATSTNVKLDSFTLGTFTLQIKELQGGMVATTTVYEDIPTATTSVARLTVGKGQSAMVLDIDGDGLTDVTLTPGGVTAEELVAVVKGLVKTLDLGKVKEKRLLNRLDKLAKELVKEHKKERIEKMKTHIAFHRVLALIDQYEKRKILSKDEAGELRTIINQIKSKVVE